MTLTLCSSAAFYKTLLEIDDQLHAMGFNTLIPISAERMRAKQDFIVGIQQPWKIDPSQYHLKTELMNLHFEKVIKGDATLVVNLEKNGMAGYIGGNVLMEMMLAFHYQKPIFILNKIDDSISYAEEIYGLQPIFLDGDLSKLPALLADTKKSQ